MSLTSVVITVVGGGIAKGILNIWLEEDPIKREIAKGAASLIASKTADEFAKSSIERQFGELGDRVARYLVPIFEEQTDLDEDEKIKVAQHVGVCLTNFNINSETLIKNDMSPNIVISLLKDNSFIPNQESTLQSFSEGQIRLFERIISESAQYIVDISSQLPSFHEKTVTELLERQSFIIENVVKLLQEVNEIKLHSASQSEIENRFESNYRRALVRKLDQLQLYGVDISTSSKRYRLSVAYISLNVDNESDEDEPVSIETCLERNNRLLIKGLAGSGKTTLLQWISVKSALFKMPDVLQEWNKSIPILIRLREYSEKKLPSTEEFLSSFASIISGEVPDRWITKKMLEGNITLLVDGIDEIEESRRSEVKEWIEEILEIYPDIRIIITSRPYAVEKNWLNSLNFTNAHLQDMDVSDIYNFMDHWHDAALDAETDGEERLKIEEKRIEIKKEVRENNNILKLATNPLLCALICALNRQTETKLPTNRIGLYEACIGMFFRRDLERKVDLKDYHEIGFEPKEIILSELAYWYIRNGLSEAEKDQVINKIEQKLNGILGIPEGVTAEGVLKYFIQRSGILRYPVSNKVDFPHRTFEEYFAAKAVDAQNDFGVLVKNVGDDQWREVIVLASGIARQSDAEFLINSILDLADVNAELTEYCVILAATCSEMAIQLDSSIRKRVKQKFEKLIPPSTMSKAKEISKIGDLALPFLKYSVNKSLSVSRLKPVIRTLAMIGDEALSTLAEYKNDSRTGILLEILESGKHAKNPEEYGKALLQGIKNVTMIGYFSLDLLKNVTSLENANLDVDSNKSRNIEALAELVNIVELHLKFWDKNALDLSPLKGMSKLEFLSLTNSSVLNIEPLIELKNLKILNLNRTKISDYSHLTKIDKLEVLYTDEPVKIFNQKILVDCKSLKEIIVPKGFKENKEFIRIFTNAHPKIRLVT